MRWRAFIVISLLLAGAAVNIGIAWACAAYSNPLMFDAIFLGRLRAQQWDGHAEKRDGVQPWLSLAFIGFGMEMVQKSENLHTQINDHSTVFIHRAGWPVRSMEGRRRCIGPLGAAPPPDHVPLSAIPIAREKSLQYPFPALGLAASSPGLLPLRPLWPGFLINTLLYALVLWLLWAIPVMIRRGVRVLRHRCPACGYQRGQSPRCTECGRVHASRAAEPPATLSP